MFAITLFGFWSVDIENRIGLVTVCNARLHRTVHTTEPFISQL